MKNGAITAARYDESNPKPALQIGRVARKPPFPARTASTEARGAFTVRCHPAPAYSPPPVCRN